MALLHQDGYIVPGSAESKVKVVLGPNSSPEVKGAYPLLSAFEVPYLSWAATDGQLSNKAAYPTFSA